MATIELQAGKCPYCRARHNGVKVETMEDDRNRLIGPIVYMCRSCGHEIDVLRLAFVLISKHRNPT